MHQVVKLLVGLGLLVPGALLLLRALHLAPPGLEAITTFVFGGLRLYAPLPAAMTVVGAILVLSVATSGPGPPPP
ncbi:MAG: hypothetical protein MUC96_11535 [Myxococcaceae bacterium]|jgi:hypothetical protein|nr:hypothetical protein [Myxococcaceae bacterium]